MFRYYKYGNCKYADKWQFRHNNVACVTADCIVFDSDKRHPVVDANSDAVELGG